MGDAFYKRFLKWWNRASAEERILEAMSFTEWRRSLAIIQETDVAVGQFHVICERLVREGIAEKRYDRTGPYTKTYVRKLKSGKRRHVERAEWSPAIDAGSWKAT